jgi:hypothetical protein
MLENLDQQLVAGLALVEERRLREEHVVENALRGGRAKARSSGLAKAPSTR